MEHSSSEKNLHLLKERIQWLNQRLEEIKKMPIGRGKLREIEELFRENSRKARESIYIPPQYIIFRLAPLLPPKHFQYMLRNLKTNETDLNKKALYLSLRGEENPYISAIMDSLYIIFQQNSIQYPEFTDNLTQMPELYPRREEIPEIPPEFDDIQANIIRAWVEMTGPESPLEFSLINENN